MFKPAFLLCVALLALLALPGQGAAAPLELHQRAEHDQAVRSYLEQNLEGLVAMYKELHRAPELSLHEEQTSAFVADRLRKAGYSVTPGVGGHGVIGVLENGPGRVLLLRGDMDALPVVEETGLPYASRARVKDDRGVEVGVMHACGHDVHVTNLLGTAAFMAGARGLWTGTLVIIAQPAEELGEGASRMIDDGLWKRIPRPNFTLALHVDAEIAAGHVGVVSGWAAANVDAVDITIFGRGGHGAKPHQTSDPIVTASHLVTALQTLVSRRLDPQEPGVVTVGSFHAGTKHNVIPDEARLQLTVRSYSDATRRLLIDGIAQLARDVCRAFQCAKPPAITVKDNFTPAVYNEPELAAGARDVFTRVFGAAAVEEPKPTMGGEDFGRYARALQVPGLLFRLGAVAPRAMKASRRKGGAPLPSLHSSKFAPLPEPTLRTGVRATANLALALLGKP